MSLDTTVLLLEAESLPDSLEEQLGKRDVFVERATTTSVAEVVPVVVPDLIVQAGDGTLGPVLASLKKEATPPPLVIIADRAMIRKLRAEKHEAIKALIPKDLPIAAVAHRLSTMARRSAEGRPLEMTQRRQSAKAGQGAPEKPVQAKPIQAEPASSPKGPASSKRGSLAPVPAAVQQNVKIVDPEEEEARKLQEQEERERKALEAAEAQERAVAAAREKKKADAAQTTKRAAEKREAEIEKQALRRKKALETKKRTRTVPRPKESKAADNSPSEVKALDELFPTEEPTAVVPAPEDEPTAVMPAGANEDEEAEAHEMTTQAVDVSAFAPALDAQARRNSTPPGGTEKPQEAKGSQPRSSTPPRAKSSPPKAKATLPKPNSAPPSKPKSAPPSSASNQASQDGFESVKKKDELSVIAPLPVAMRMELAPQTDQLPAIRLALLDTDLTRADAVSASLRDIGMKIHPITPDTTKTRWPMLRRFAPQGLVVDEKSMARGASEWVETFRGDPFLRHVPVILVRFSRLFDEDAGEVILDPLLHLIEHLGREEFALLDKLSPGRQVDLWLSQVAPFRLVEMLTKEDRNTRLDCKSRTERMVWHLGPGYAGKGKLADLKTNQPKERLSPEDSMAWLLSHEDCQVAVHEHSEPLAHASESKDSESLLRELTDGIAAPSRHESVRPGAPGAAPAPSFRGSSPARATSEANNPSVAMLSSSALMSEGPSPTEAPVPSVAQANRGGGVQPPTSRKPLLSDARKAQLRAAMTNARSGMAEGYGVYQTKVASLASPLEGRVPAQVLAQLHWIIPASVAVLFVLVMGLSSGESAPAETDRTAKATAKKSASPKPEAKANKPAGRPPKQSPKKEEPKAEEAKEQPNETDLWKVAPDAKLPSCKERLGAAAPQSKNPIKSMGYWKNARKLLMVGKTDEAIENMCLAGLFDPSGPASEGLAEYYLGQRSLEQAERWIRLSLKADESRRRSQELLGDIENQKGNVDESRKLLLDTMRLSGDETKKMELTARKLRQDATLARKGGDLARAERELRRAVLLTPEDAVLAGELGEILLRRKAADAAALWAARALKLNPDYSVAKLLAGRIAEAQGKKDQARSFYEMVPIGDPFHKEAQRRRNLL